MRPGLLDTPMAVDARAAHLGIPREQVVAAGRDGPRCVGG